MRPDTETMTPGQRIAYRIDYWRRQRGMTFAELFAKSGNDKPSYYKLAKGLVKEPRLSTVQAYADVLGVPVEFLLHGHPETDPGAAMPVEEPQRPDAAPSLADALEKVLPLRGRPKELRIIHEFTGQLLAASAGKADAPSPARAPASPGPGRRPPDSGAPSRPDPLAGNAGTNCHGG